MGIFSSKYKTVVGTSISKLGDAKKFLSSKRTGVMSATVRNAGMPESIMRNLMAGAAFKAKSAYNYAGTGYTFGRPNTTIFQKSGTFGLIATTIADYLQDTYGATTEVFYTFYGSGNYYHKAYAALHAYGYNFETKELPTLTASKGFTVTLIEAELKVSPSLTLAVIDNFKSLTPLGGAIVVSREDELITGINLAIKYTWTEMPGSVVKEQTATIAFNIHFNEAELENTYCLAMYKTPASDVGFLTYLMGSGGITTLDNVFDTGYSVPGTYMPRLYCRWEFQRGDYNKVSTEYKHSVQMARRMGMKYQDLVDGVNKVNTDVPVDDPEYRDQSDLDLVRSGFVSYMVQADSTAQLEIEYLYNHFEDWFTTIGGVITTVPLVTFNATVTVDDLFEHVLIIQDSRFKATIGMQGIWKRTVMGVVAPLGEYHATKGEITITSGGGGSPDEFIPTTSVTHPYHVYRYQETADSYIEYEIIGLESKHYVTGEHYSASGYTTDVSDEKDILYVPINYEIVKKLQIFDQEELMYNSIHFVANSFQVVKVKWYQRSGWGTVFKIVGIVLMFTGFYELGKIALGFVELAMTSIVIAMEYLIAVITIYLPVIYTFVAAKVALAIAGEELSFLIAVVLATFGYFKFDLAGFSAESLLSAGNALFKEISAYTGKKMADLQADFDTLKHDYEEKFEELDRLREEMYNPNHKYTSFIVGETAEAFYNRTTHIGNPGTKVFDLLSNHVAIALRLPTLNDTLKV